MRKLVFLFAFLAVPLFAGSQKTALLSTSSTTARTAGPVTNQTDNLRLEATVKWLGPSNLGSLIVYNGNGCCSGWGILVLASTDNPPNVLAVLAGGITVAPSTITLTPNVWQHIVMDRVNGDVTLTVTSVAEGNDGQDNHRIAPQTDDLGGIGVNPLSNYAWLRPPLTYVGDAFNGFIANATITDLTSTPNMIESWDFSQPPATFGNLGLFGATAPGANGHTLNLTSVWAVQVPSE